MSWFRDWRCHIKGKEKGAAREGFWSRKKEKQRLKARKREGDREKQGRLSLGSKNREQETGKGSGGTAKEDLERKMGTRVRERER